MGCAHCSVLSSPSHRMSPSSLDSGKGLRTSSTPQTIRDLAALASGRDACAPGTTTCLGKGGTCKQQRLGWVVGGVLILHFPFWLLCYSVPLRSCGVSICPGVLACLLPCSVPKSHSLAPFSGIPGGTLISTASSNPQACPSGCLDPGSACPPGTGEPPKTFVCSQVLSLQKLSLSKCTGMSL